MMEHNQDLTVVPWGSTLTQTRTGLRCIGFGTRDNPHRKVDIWEMTMDWWPKHRRFGGYLPEDTIGVTTIANTLRGQFVVQVDPWQASGYKTFYTQEAPPPPRTEKLMARTTLLNPFNFEDDLFEHGFPVREFDHVTDTLFRKAELMHEILDYTTPVYYPFPYPRLNDAVGFPPEWLVGIPGVLEPTGSGFRENDTEGSDQEEECSGGCGARRPADRPTPLGGRTTSRGRGSMPARQRRSLTPSRRSISPTPCLELSGPPRGARPRQPYKPIIKGRWRQATRAERVRFNKRAISLPTRRRSVSRSKRQASPPRRNRFIRRPQRASRSMSPRAGRPMSDRHLRRRPLSPNFSGVNLGARLPHEFPSQGPPRNLDGKFATNLKPGTVRQRDQTETPAPAKSWVTDDDKPSAEERYYRMKLAEKIRKDRENRYVTIDSDSDESAKETEQASPKKTAGSKNASATVSKDPSQTARSEKDDNDVAAVLRIFQDYRGRPVLKLSRNNPDNGSQSNSAERPPKVTEKTQDKDASKPADSTQTEQQTQRPHRFSTPIWAYKRDPKTGKFGEPKLVTTDEWTPLLKTGHIITNKKELSDDETENQRDVASDKETEPGTDRDRDLGSDTESMPDLLECTCTTQDDDPDRPYRGSAAAEPDQCPLMREARRLDALTDLLVTNMLMSMIDIEKGMVKAGLHKPDGADPSTMERVQKCLDTISTKTQEKRKHSGDESNQNKKQKKDDGEEDPDETPPPPPRVRVNCICLLCAACRELGFRHQHCGDCDPACQICDAALSHPTDDVLEQFHLAVLPAEPYYGCPICVDAQMTPTIHPAALCAGDVVKYTRKRDSNEKDAGPESVAPEDEPARPPEPEGPGSPDSARTESADETAEEAETYV